VAVADLTAVTVTYGSSDTLSRTCASLARSTRDSSNIAIEHVVVTQPDESGERATHPTTTREIRLNENLPIPTANNLAVEESTSEFIAFLNPDLELTEGWLNPSIDALNDPAVAIAAPVLLNNHGDIDEAGQAVFSDGSSLAMGGSHWPDFPNSYASMMFDRDVDYASAACWVMRRSTFNDLGGFSTEYYPAYFEDNDFGQRAQHAGFVTRLITARPVVHHHEGASADRRALAERSRATFELTWAEHLRSKPHRSLLDKDAILIRDHLCITTNIEQVTSSTIGAYAERVVADPRNRYIAIIDENDDVPLHHLRRQHAPYGLEIRLQTPETRQ
jgi:GT2 family glycosyltransferase